MESSLVKSAELPLPLLVPAGEDRFGAFKPLGISSVAFKITSQESKDLFAVEITLLEKGGPAKLLHYYQDEWFYILEGVFIIEAGDQRFHLTAGDSLFVQKKVPHAWANAGPGRGRLLATVSPAINREEFFSAAGKTNALPGPDQSQWQPYGMEWVGPPLVIE